MMIVNKLKVFTAVLGIAAAVTSALVWAETPASKPTIGGFNPIGVKLNDNVLSSRFAKAPVVTYETRDGDTIFALQLKPPLKPVEVRPRDLVVMVDTSASQAGKFLDASRKIVEQLIRDASPADRLSLWVINTPSATRRLSKGLEFAGNREKTVSMLRALEAEYPSGAVDLKNGIDEAVKDFDGKISRQQIVVYLGDAESAFAPLNEKDRYQLANKVRESKVQFFAVPLGTAINGMNMHSLVTGTGGSVVRFSDDIHDSKQLYEDLSRRLFESFQVPVLMSSKLTFGAAVAEFYPTRLPPLRSDTPTLVVGRFAKGKVPANLEGTIEGRVGRAETKVTFGETVPGASVDHFFLTTIIRQWSESNLKEAPAVLRADRTLALAFEQGRLTRDELLTQIQWALAANKFETAKNLSEAANKIDSDNPEVKALVKIIDKLDKGRLTLAQLNAATGNRMGVHYEKLPDGTIAHVRVPLESIAADDPPPAVPVGNPQEMLKSEQARKAIVEQQVSLTVQETLARARDLLRSGDPRAAKDLVLAQRDSIKTNTDIAEQLRAQLTNRMELLLADIGQRGEIILRAKADESEKIAQARAKLMATDTKQAQEERTRAWITAFTNLMSQARYEDAYRESLKMMQERANDGQPVPLATQAVYQMGQSLTNLREMRELTRIREDRFLLTMMNVEKSHIPYPDEPPVHFPPSKVWKDLMETRKRYATNDFEGDIPARSRKRMEFLKSALDNPIPEIDKGDQPLPVLIEVLQAMASPPGADKDPSRRVTIILNVDAFSKENGEAFDPERKQIKINTKLAGVSLSTVLRIICDQLGGTYWVKRDYIEIVPAGMAITEKVTRVFPVGDLIIGIPNAINQSALSQSISVLGATFSLGGGFTGAPVVINGNAGGGLGFGVPFGIGVGIAGGGGGGQPFGGLGAGAAGGLFNGGCNGGIRGFGGGIQGQFGNLGGQFGFQGQDYGPVLIQLITEVVAKGEWATPQNLFCPGGGGGAPGNIDPQLDVGQTLKPEQLNSMGYWPPARALIIRGTSRIHRTSSSKLTPKGIPGANVNLGPQGGDPDVIGQIGGNVVKTDPKTDSKTDPKTLAAERERKRDELVRRIVEKEKNLDPEKIYQMLLDNGMTEPGEIIACADFMVNCKQFKHAAELLKASLRNGVVAEPWAQEALAIALEGSQGLTEEIERARVSAIDLAPKSALAYVKAAKAMADMGQMDRAMKFCREAARLEPNSPEAYVNALAFAGDKKATLDAGASAWAAGNLLARDWTGDTAEYHQRARSHLKDQIAKFASQNKPAEAKTVQAVLDNEKRRDLVIELLFSGAADLDLKVREPIGTVCSSLERQSAGGGILLCDDFTQKDDSRSVTYKASEAFNGSYQVSVDRVWGRPLGNRALIKVTRHQGTPEQTVEVHPIDLSKQTTLQVSFEGGRRRLLAGVPPVGAARKPEREHEAMNKLQAMINGGNSVMSGGTGSATQRVSTAHDNFDSPLVELSNQTSIASVAPGGLEIRQQTTMSKDGKQVQVKMAPVFETAAAKGAKLKLDFIPGAE